MSITAIVAAIGLTAFALGALVGWLITRAARLETERSLKDAFRSLSGEALEVNNRLFLSLAEARLGQARVEASHDIDERKKAIEDLVAPLKQTLQDVDREIKDSERRQKQSGDALLGAVASLDGMGRNLRTETARLVDALKRPGVRGRWGEIQLKRVVELAGMVERCDFDEQHTLTAPGVGEPDRRLRPDVIVRLPGGKNIVVDAKVPLDAYLKALEAPDEATRQSLLADHARQVKTHLIQLSAKGYAAHVQPSPDFVVMFLPGEMFFSAALEQDPSLIETGVNLHVIPASPTTLIALLRAVAYGWQQETVEENARKIGELGRNLYESIHKLAGNFDKLGARLKSSLDAYNETVGSLEGNVLVKARKFKDLEVAQSAESIEAIEPIDRVPRLIQARELTDALPFADD